MPVPHPSYHSVSTHFSLPQLQQIIIVNYGFLESQAGASTVWESHGHTKAVSPVMIQRKIQPVSSRIDKQKKYVKEASLIYMLITYLHDLTVWWEARGGGAQQGSDEIVGGPFYGSTKQLHGTEGGNGYWRPETHVPNPALLLLVVWL